MKFVSKLLLCLRYVDNHLGDAGAIGVIWCQDGVHFLCNSKILGSFLELKSNSINTNFREHGFQICPYTSAQSSVSILPDVQHWKKRRHQTDGLTRQSSFIDAESIGMMKPQIPEQSSSPSSVPVPDRQIPWSSHSSTAPPPNKPVICPSRAVNENGIPDTLQLILEDNRPMQLSVQMIMEKSSGSESWKNRMIVTVTRDWITAFGTVISISMRLLLDHLLSSVTMLPRETYNQLASNIEYLLLAHNDTCSQRSDDVFFDNYLLLMLRYGPAHRLATSMLELAAHEMADPFIDLKLSQSALPLSQGTCLPNFKPWFHPGLNTRTAALLLNQQTRSAWMIRPSSTPNMFTIHCKMVGKLIASHVRYDGLEVPDRVYSIKLDNNQVRYAATWSQLLFTELELRYEECVCVTETETDRLRTEIVSGNGVIAGNREALLMCLEP